ncbi:ABC transporter substrate-binding protein [Agrobacterium sp. AGB01]|uniref:ABC transporter substrate-binding protein n=1 Tax=Agrobacterium sp. AGB01 TaxID=2769302 RepID=UPI00177EFE55|nr:ABC transporter substrate-binding protein [Agrobacterium sp. AGB01]MBD9388538.1 ABC transporter substrate-binding protein [Agrobacterium sp. AGB01]
MKASTSISFVGGLLALLPAALAHASGDEAKPVSGGTLKVAVHEAPVCVDPIQITNFTPLNIARNFAISLTDQDPITGDVKPWAAERWEINGDATEYTYHLRKDITYADGQKLDAKSVQANLENIRNKIGPKANRPYNYLSYYAGSDIVDDHTIKIKFSHPAGHFLTAASSAWLALYSDATLARSAEERCAGNLVSAGPFNLVKYSQLEGATLERREDYVWPSASSTNQGKPYLKKIEFIIAPEDNVRTGLLQSGEVQLVTNVNVADQSSLEASGFVLQAGRNPGTPFGVQFNVKTPILSDIKVRQALLHFIDRQEMIAALESPKAIPATGVLVSTVPGAIDQSKDIAYDPALSNKILDEAGWATRDAAGIRTKDGKPLRLTLSGYGNYRGQAEYIQQAAKKIGIDLALETIPDGSDIINNILNPHKFEAIFGNATEADPDVLRSYFGPEQRNVPNSDDEWLKKALIEQLAFSKLEDRFAKIAEIQKHIVEQAYTLPLYPVTQVLGRDAKLHGALPDVLVRLRLEAAWLEQ